MQEKNEIQKELESMNSKLGHISKAMPYSVPDNYFEAFAERMTAFVKEEDILVNLPKNTPFETPAAYFDQLPEKVLAAAKESEKSKTRIIALNGNGWKNVRLAAAAVLLLLAGSGIFKIALQQNSFDQRMAAVPDEAIKEYVLQNSTELNAGNTAIASNTTLPSQLTDEEITQYLNETGWQ
jgi:hypothetical protein